MAYKEKDTKKWTAQWFETNAKGEKKKRRKRGFSTKKEALEYERQKKLNSSRSMDMKLSEFMEVYFEDKQNELKERTMKNKRYMMEQHIIPYFGNQMMSEISASQIIQWQNEMQTKRLFGIISANDTKSANQLVYSCFKDLRFAYESMQEGKADGKLGQQKLGFLDNRGVSAVYSDYRTGNKILSHL